jgi:hypothetical protein
MFLGGTQQLTLQDAEGLKTKVFPSASAAVVVAAGVAAFIFAGQQAYADPPSSLWRSQPASTVVVPIPVSKQFSIPPQTEDRPSAAVWGSVVSGKTPPVISTIVGGPLPTDVTQQALFATPIPGRQGAVPPVIAGAPQADPSQIAAQVWGAQPAAPVVPNPTGKFFALPPQALDFTQHAWLGVPALSRQGAVPRAFREQFPPSRSVRRKLTRARLHREFGHQRRQSVGSLGLSMSGALMR